MRKRRGLILTKCKEPIWHLGLIQVPHQITPPPQIPTPLPRPAYHSPASVSQQVQQVGLQAPTCEETDSYCGPSFHHHSFSFLPLSSSPTAPGSNREVQTSARNPSAPLLHCARMLKRGRGWGGGGGAAHGLDWTDRMERLCLPLWCVFSVIKTGERST